MWTPQPQPDARMWTTTTPPTYQEYELNVESPEEALRRVHFENIYGDYDNREPSPSLRNTPQLPVPSSRTHRTTPSVLSSAPYSPTPTALSNSASGAAIQQQDSNVTLNGNNNGVTGSMMGLQIEKPLPRRSRKECSRCCLWICGVFVLLLIALCVLMFFLWPRKPDVQVLGYSQPDNAQALYERTSDGFKINLNLDVLVNNPNYIDIAFNSIQINGYPIDNSDVLIGSGEVTDITFKKNRNTTFTFPFSLIYTPSIPEEVITSILDACGLNDGKVGDLGLDLNIALDFKVLSWSGYIPKIDEKITFTCPINLQDSMVGLAEFLIESD